MLPTVVYAHRALLDTTVLLAPQALCRALLVIIVYPLLLDLRDLRDLWVWP